MPETNIVLSINLVQRKQTPEFGKKKSPSLEVFQTKCREEKELISGKMKSMVEKLHI